MVASPDDDRALARKLSRWLFILLTCCYAIVTTGHLDTPDGIVVFNVTRALAHGSLSFPSLARFVALAGPPAPPGPGGAERQYGKYGLGLSFAALPGYAASRVLLPLTSSKEKDVFLTPPVIEGMQNRSSTQPTEWGDGRSFRGLSYDVTPARFEQAFSALWVSWTNAWIAAAVAALALLLLVEIGYAPRAATAAALALALASPLLHYATAFFAEPLVGLLILAVLLYLIRYRRSGRARQLLVAGLCLGCVGLTKVALLALGLPALAAVALGWRGHRSSAVIREIALLGAGMLAPLGLCVAYNLVRFGTPFETGYGEEANAWSTPFAEGVRGLLVSPGRGVLLYCPAVIAGFGLLPRLWRRSREAAVFAGLGLPVLVLLYSRWWLWEGGWCWGPRFLLPGLILALLPLAEHFQGGGRRLARRGVDLLIGASALVSFSSMLVNFADYYMWMKRYTDSHPEVLTARGYDNYYGLIRWDWDFSPLVMYWSFPRPNYLLITSALEKPGIVLGLFVLAALAALLSAGQIFRLTRASAKR